MSKVVMLPELESWLKSSESQQVREMKEVQLESRHP